VFPSATRSALLDGWRGIAVLLVLAYHVFYSWFDALPVVGWTTARPFAVVYSGSTGVGLFFLLSAWVLADRYADTRWTAATRRAFWSRRLWRIAPLWYLILAAMTVWRAAGWTPPLPTPWQWTGGSLLARLVGVWAWTSTPNAWVGVEWSLGVEVTFYAIWPWWLPFWQRVWHRLAPSQRPAAIGAVITGSWATAALAFSASHSQSWAVFWPPTQAAYFILGIWWRDTVTSQALAPWRPGIRWILGLGLGVVWLTPWPPLLQVLIFPGFWWLLLRVTYPWAPGGVTRGGLWLRAWGRRSYTAYFAHWLALLALWSLIAPHAGVWPRWAIDSVVGIGVVAVTAGALRWAAPLVEDRWPTAAAAACGRWIRLTVPLSDSQQ
jgi:peptidoglycan/LPS O-acetylase OafA/YrhL